MAKVKRNITVEKGKVETGKSAYPWVARLGEVHVRSYRQAQGNIISVTEPYPVYGGGPSFAISGAGVYAVTPYAAGYPPSMNWEQSRGFASTVKELREQLSRTTAALENVALQK